MQPIVIEQKETPQGVPVLVVRGEVDLHTAPALRSALYALLDAGRYTIVIDMGEVPYLDSAALGVLVETVRRSREKDGAIYLVSMTPFVRRAFDITRLVRIFEIHATEADAIAAIEAKKNVDGGEEKSAAAIPTPPVQ